MALTLNSIVRSERSGRSRKTTLSVAADNAYPTGGYAFDLLTVAGYKDVDFVEAEKTGGRKIEYDRANKKMKFFDSAGGETGNGTDLSALTDIRLRIQGH